MLRIGDRQTRRYRRAAGDVRGVSVASSMCVPALSLRIAFDIAGGRLMVRS